jgi:two-component sensor histidine kinase
VAQMNGSFTYKNQGGTSFTMTFPAGSDSQLKTAR